MEPEENWNTIVQILPALIQAPGEDIVEGVKERAVSNKEVHKQPTVGAVSRILPQSFTTSSNAQRHLDALGKKKPTPKIHTDLSSQAGKLGSLLSSTSSRSSTSENRPSNNSSQMQVSSSTNANGASGTRRNHGLSSTHLWRPTLINLTLAGLASPMNPKKAPLNRQQLNQAAFKVSIAAEAVAHLRRLPLLH